MPALPRWAKTLTTTDREELVRIKKLLPDNHELRKVQIRALRDDALDALEPTDTESRT